MRFNIVSNLHICDHLLIGKQNRAYSQRKFRAVGNVTIKLTRFGWVCLVLHGSALGITQNDKPDRPQLLVFTPVHNSGRFYSWWFRFVSE